jgi:hypothetical protein
LIDRLTVASSLVRQCSDCFKDLELFPIEKINQSQNIVINQMHSVGGCGSGICTPAMHQLLTETRFF